MRRALGVVLVGMALVGAPFVACSASSKTQPTQTGQGGDTAGAGGGLGGDIESGGAAGFGGGCVGTSYEADPVPLDMFIMLDQSGSMNDPAGNGSTRWQMVKEAITAFVEQPNLDGMSLGLQYFGQPVPSVSGCHQISCVNDDDCIAGGCTQCLPLSHVCQSTFNPDEDSCDPVEYAWAEVPIAPLPGVGTDIITSMGMHGPGTNTPTLPAITGAIDYAKAWQIAHPANITVVAFATDGGPANCGIELDPINDVIEAGYLGLPSIRTYVIGVGPLIAALDGFAAAGGTTEAFRVDDVSMATENFVDALNQIRGAALPCTYQIPEPPEGMELDFNQVNVTVTPDGGPTETLPRVQTPAECPASGQAWYYDDNASPTQIILCDGACDELGDTLGAEVEIVLGCLTVVM